MFFAHARGARQVPGVDRVDLVVVEVGVEHQEAVCVVLAEGGVRLDDRDIELGADLAHQRPVVSTHRYRFAFRKSTRNYGAFQVTDSGTIESSNALEHGLRRLSSTRSIVTLAQTPVSPGLNRLT